MIKEYRPTTPGRRGMTTQDLSGITHKKPIKSLITIKKKTAGRNNQGRITTRHKGGGVKQFYRNVNFKLEDGLKATVEGIEYDPNRSARIARIKDQNGRYHYVLADSSMAPGTKIESGKDASVEASNRLALKNIPVGTLIYNIELRPGQGGTMVRSAGTSAQLMAKEGDYAQVRMPSGEVRLVSMECMANIGVLGNEQHLNVKIGKAGRNRHRGIRPSVRGMAMNAVDHPHGGGEGRGKGGNNPTSPWGQPTRGYKTRKRKSTNQFIVKSRHEAKRS